MSDDTRHTPEQTAWEKLNGHVNEYINEYEFRGDADYSPNDGEKMLIHDAVAGLIEDEDFRDLWLKAQWPELEAENASLRAALEAEDSAVMAQQAFTAHVVASVVEGARGTAGEEAKRLRMLRDERRMKADELRKAALAQSGGSTLQPTPGKEQP